MAAACLRCPAWAWLKHREGGALAARTAPNQSSCGCLSGLLSGVVCGKEFELDGQSKWEWEAQCSSMRASQIFRSDLLLFMSKHQHPEHYLCSGLAKVKPCFLMMMVWRETHTHTHTVEQWYVWNLEGSEHTHPYPGQLPWEADSQARRRGGGGGKMTCAPCVPERVHPVIEQNISETPNDIVNLKCSR